MSALPSQPQNRSSSPSQAGFLGRYRAATAADHSPWRRYPTFYGGVSGGTRWSSSSTSPFERSGSAITVTCREVVPADDDHLTAGRDDDDHDNWMCDDDSFGDEVGRDMSLEEVRNSSWLRGFLARIRELSPEEANDPVAAKLCPACKGDRGGSLTYPGFRALLDHARGAGPKRVWLHRWFAHILEEELRNRSVGRSPDASAKGNTVTVKRTVDGMVLWPPMVVVLNTRVGKREGSDKGSRQAMARNLDFLESMLPVETAWLEEVEARDSVDEVTKLRKKEIKAWAYDVEDVLDEWEFLRAEMEAARVTTARRRYERDPVPDLLTDPSFSRRVNDLKQKYVEIARDSRALSQWAGQGSRPHARNAPDSSLVNERGVFDDKDSNKEAFVQFMLSAEEATGQRLAVAPIGGPPGVGKTNLAKLAYNDPEVYGHFGRRGWVTASQHLEMMGLKKAIGESLTGEVCSSSQSGGLQDHLKQKTDGQRILLVLDDVQESTLYHWEELLVSFGGWAGGSVIILTSSNERIFNSLRMLFSFDKECLSSYHCWFVFREHAFSALPPDDDPRKEIGKKIAMECEGLPSVAKALGASLRYERDVGVWEEFLQRDMWDVEVPELRWWYLNLSAHLKRCFVYCSMFPRGHLFKREELIWLWMAQGFIQGKGERSLADVGLNVGVKCFDDLLSMFLCRNSQADEESFVMYKFLHAFAQSISEGGCLTVGDGNLCSPTEIDPDKARHTRHLSLTPSNIELVTQSLPYPTLLRTFVVLQASPHKIIGDINLSDEVFHRMKYLRVLDVSNTDVASLPTTIVNLKHLRYLNLSGTKIKNLHVSVFGLYNLQTLNLSFTDITELPDLFGNLKLLCFLFLNHTKIEMLPESICELCNLHTLDLSYTEIRDLQTSDQNESGIRNDGLPDAIGDLSKLCNLGLNVTKIRKLPESIGKLSRLQTLHLSGTKIEELPKTIGNLKVLKFLCLNVSKIQRGLESISELYNLQALQLQGAEGDTLFECLSENQSQDAEDENPNNHAISIDRDSGKQLNEHSAQTRFNHDVSDMPDSNIDNFIASSDDAVKERDGVGFPTRLEYSSFSNLARLVLKNCIRCEALPRLGQLPLLKELDIDGMLVERVGRDFCGHVEKGFPSLEKLSFQNMCKWKEWDGVETGDFPSLDELILFNCPKLKGVPFHLSSLTKLKVERCAVNTIPTTESLSDLELCACDNLSELPSLDSVRNLTLMYCQNLASLPSISIKSLEMIWIEECEKLLPDNISLLSELRKLLPEAVTGQYFSLSELKICRLLSTVFSANVDVGNRGHCENLQIEECEQLEILILHQGSHLTAVFLEEKEPSA